MSGRSRSSDRPGAPRSGRGTGRDGGPRDGRRRAGGDPARGQGPRLDLLARRERVREVVEPVVSAAGYDLEELTLSRAGRRTLVRVVMDGDGGVSLDAVADVSRAVSAALDAAEEAAGELLPGEYALEVGSPGVDRPLTLPRHWRRNVGRLVAVPLRAGADGERRPAGQITGRVLAADDEGIVLEAPGGARELAYEELGPGRVQIEFTRWGGVEDGDPEEPDGDDPADLDDEDLEEER